jgi:hypothetical protein
MAALVSFRLRFSLCEKGSLLFTESLMSPTVEARVDVLAIETVSTSFAGWAGLFLGEAGWNHVGGFSLGYSC